MNWRNLSCSVIALVLLSSLAYTQSPPASGTPRSTQPLSPRPAKPQFFAGVVIEVDDSHVKVSRDLVGRPTETRIFSVNARTKTPKGGIKPKSRVTVRYQHLPEQDLALEIQVRPLSRTPKTT